MEIAAILYIIQMIKGSKVKFFITQIFDENNKRLLQGKTFTAKTFFTKKLFLNKFNFKDFNIGNYIYIYIYIYID